MQNEEETPKKEMILARKMAYCALKKEPFDNVLLEYPPNLKQAVYAIAIGLCAQMNEKEALDRIRDDCPPHLKQAIFFEAMDIFTKEEYHDIFKRIENACSPILIKAIFSKAITDYINEEESGLNMVKAAGASGLIENIFCQKMMFYAKNEKILKRIINKIPPNLEEKLLTFAISICKNEDYKETLDKLTDKLKKVKLNQLFVPIKHRESEKKNPTSTENDSEKKPSFINKKNLRLR